MKKKYVWLFCFICFAGFILVACRDKEQGTKVKDKLSAYLTDERAVTYEGYTYFRDIGGTYRISSDGIVELLEIRGRVQSFYQDELYYISYKTKEEASHLYKANLDGRQSKLLREYVSWVIIYKDKVYYTMLNDKEDKEKYTTELGTYEVTEDVRVMNLDGSEDEKLASYKTDALVRFVIYDDKIYVMNKYGISIIDLEGNSLGRITEDELGGKPSKIDLADGHLYVRIRGRGIESSVWRLALELNSNYISVPLVTIDEEVRKFFLLDDKLYALIYRNPADGEKFEGSKWYVMNIDGKRRKLLENVPSYLQ